MAQHRSEEPEIIKKLESLSKDELIQIIHQFQNQQVTDTISSVSNDNEKKPSNILLHKRSKTAVNSYETTEIQMESPDNQSFVDDDHKAKIKIVLKYKYCVLNFIGSIIGTYFMSLIDVVPKWLVLIIFSLSFVTIDLLCYKHASILMEVYSIFISLIYSIKPTETTNIASETASYDSTVEDHND